MLTLICNHLTETDLLIQTAYDRFWSFLLNWLLSVQIQFDHSEGCFPDWRPVTIQPPVRKGARTSTDSRTTFNHTITTTIPNNDGNGNNTIMIEIIIK